MSQKNMQEVYAIVRLDRFHGDEMPLEDLFTVKEIVPTVDEAEREVQRLNALKPDGGSLYFWRYSRFYPGGRELSDDPVDPASVADR